MRKSRKRRTVSVLLCLALTVTQVMPAMASAAESSSAAAVYSSASVGTPDTGASGAAGGGTELTGNSENSDTSGDGENLSSGTSADTGGSGTQSSAQTENAETAGSGTDGTQNGADNGQAGQSDTSGKSDTEESQGGDPADGAMVGQDDSQESGGTAGTAGDNPAGEGGTPASGSAEAQENGWEDTDLTRPVPEEADTPLTPEESRTVIDGVTEDLRELEGTQQEIDGADISWYTAEETSFSLTSAQQLKGLALLVSKGENFSGKTVTLGNDIDMEGIEWSLPVGNTEETPFGGIFDGAGYTISNFESGTEAQPASFTYTGFFGYLENGEIRDLTLSGSVTAHRTSGVLYAGGLAASAENVTVSDVTVDVHVNASAGSGTLYAGGMFGHASDVTADTSEITGDLTVSGGDGNRTYAGGYAGYAQRGGMLINSGSTGTVSVRGDVIFAGGLAGYLTGAESDPTELLNSFRGGVFQSEADSGYAGGLAGYIGPGSEVRNCYTSGYYEADFAAKSSPGSEADKVSGFTLNSASAGESDGMSGHAGRIAGGICAGTSSAVSCCYAPAAEGETSAAPADGNTDADDENAEDPESEKDAADAADALPLIGEAGSGAGQSGNEVFQADGTFVGGLAGYSTTLNAEDCENKGAVTGEQNVGGLFGSVRASDLNRCFNRADVSASSSTAAGLIAAAGSQTSNGTQNIRYCSNTGDISGESTVGGLVASVPRNSTLTMEKCSNIGDVTGTSSYVGALAANMTTTRSGNTISDCYAVGTVSGGESNTGALAGYFGSSTASTTYMTMENCFFYDVSEAEDDAVTSLGMFGSYKEGSVSNCYYLKGSEGGVFPEDSSVTVDASFFSSEDGLFRALGGSQSPWKLEAGAAYPVLKTQEEYDAVTYTLSLEKVAASEDLSSIRMIAGDRETSGGSIDVTSGTSVTIEITVPEEGRLVVSSALGELTKKEDSSSDETGGTENDGGDQSSGDTGEAEGSDDEGAGGSDTTEDGDGSDVSSESGPVTYVCEYQFDGRTSESFLYYYKAGAESEEERTGWYTDPSQGGTYDDGNYHISTAAQLEYLSQLVSGTYYNEVGEFVSLETEAENFADKTILLEADIDLTAVCGASGFDAGGNYTGASGTYAKNWSPIGTSSSTAFRGTFDGQGHTISGLYIDTSSNYQGLFGYITGAEIRNLTVSGDVNGGRYEAILAAYAAGTVSVENVTVCGSVTGGSNYTAGFLAQTASGAVLSMENCVNEAQVTGFAYVGAFVGGLSGTSAQFSFCSSRADISGTGSYTGGLLGYVLADVTMDHCSSSGNISAPNPAGLIGQFSASDENVTITDCYVAGTVTGTETAAGFLAELPSGGYIENCFFYGTEENAVSGASGDSVLCSDFAPGKIENCYWRSGSSFGSVAPNEETEVNETFFASADGLLAALNPENGWMLEDSAAYPSLMSPEDFMKVEHTITLKETEAGDDGVSVSMSAGEQSAAESGGVLTLKAVPGTEITVVFTVPAGEHRLVVPGDFGEGQTETASDGTTAYTYTFESGTESQTYLYYYEEGSSERETPDWEGLSGTEAQTYTITTARELQYLSELVAGYYINEIGERVSMTETIDFRGGKTFLLGNDIDLSTVCGPTGFDEGGNYVGESGTFSKNWTPIGTSDAQSFSGVLDGQGYTVSGLYIDSTENYQGLFGYVQKGTASTAGMPGIKNVNAEGSVSGSMYTGGIAGYVSSNTYSGSTIPDMLTGNSFSGQVSGDDYTGGITGYVNSYAAISDCSVKPGTTVTSTGDYAGGIAGYLRQSISLSGCTAEDISVSGGDYTGGIAGYIAGRYSSSTSSTFQSTISNNSISGDSTVSGGSYVGGVFGSASQTVYSRSDTGDNLYGAVSFASVSGTGDYVGGVIGQGTFDGLTPSILLNLNPETVTSSDTSAEHVGQIIGDGEIKESWYMIPDGVSAEDESAVSASGFAHGEVLYLLQHAEQPDSENPLYWSQGASYPELVSDEESAAPALYKVNVEAQDEKDYGVVEMSAPEDETSPEWGYQVFEKDGALYTFVFSGSSVRLTSSDPLIDFSPSGVVTEAGETPEGAVQYTVAVEEEDLDITYYTYQDIEADTSWYSEDESSFTISDEADFRGLAELVNGGNDFAGKTVTMSGDIAFTSGRSWTPAGSGENPFAGTFDGAGHAVSGLFLLRSEYEDTGLFGYVTGEIRNLSVSGTIDGTEDSAVYVGGITGRNAGTLSDITSDVTVHSSALYTGGIAGSNERGGVISGLTSASSVTVENTSTHRAGGVAGENRGTVEDASFTGSLALAESGGSGYAGGICGYNTGDLILCSRTGEISGSAEYIGGIVGKPQRRLRGTVRQ